MILSWYGLACIKLETQGQVIVLNPFKKDAAQGLEKAPRFKADIALISAQTPEYNNPEMVEATEFVIDSPGEYELKEIFIQAVSSQKGQTTSANANLIFLVKSEGLRLAHLGGLSEPKLPEDAVELLEGVDVLLLPVGGAGVLNSVKAASLVTQLEPSLAIPIFYATPGLKLKLDSVEKFVNEIKLEPIKEEKLKVQKKDLATEGTKLVLLVPQL